MQWMGNGWAHRAGGAGGGAYKDTAPLDVAPAVPPAVDELPRFHMLWPSVFHPHKVDSKSQFTASANGSRVPSRGLGLLHWLRQMQDAL